MSHNFTEEAYSIINTFLVDGMFPDQIKTRMLDDGYLSSHFISDDIAHEIYSTLGDCAVIIAFDDCDGNELFCKGTWASNEAECQSYANKIIANTPSVTSFRITKLSI